MIYYLIKNEDGFEELVFEGSREEVESKKMALESTPGPNSGQSGWTRVKYYIFPETDWVMEIGTMH
jgi:hypothetical protein